MAALQNAAIKHYLVTLLTDLSPTDKLALSTYLNTGTFALFTTSAPPITIGTVNLPGIANFWSRSDHQHAHGNQTDQTLHALAVAGVSHGFMSATDKANLDGFVGGGVPSNRQVSTTTPLQGGGDLTVDRTISILAATPGNAGSMSAADKAKLDSFTPIEPLYNQLWVDTNTTLATLDQDGSVNSAYKTVQQALDHIAASSLYGWRIVIMFGNYSAEALTIPQNKSILFEGFIRHPLMSLGTISWTVTGNLTSLIAFRNLVVGAITVVDGAPPAVNAVATFENCQCSGIATTGTSFLTVLMAGGSLASFSSIATPVVAAVVRNNPINFAGVLLTQNVQFEASCPLIDVTVILADGSSFDQDIEIRGTVAEFSACSWGATPRDIEFTGSPGIVTMDQSAHVEFVDNGGAIVNGKQSVDFDFLADTGLISGGMITRGAGRDINVTAGVGNIQIGSQLFYVEWGATTVTAAANNSFWVYVDEDGVINCDNAQDPKIHILLAKGYADSSSTIVLTDLSIDLPNLTSQLHDYARDVIGPVLAEGLATIEHGPPSLQLAVAAGEFYIDNQRLSATATAPITFRYWYMDGIGGWTTVASQTAIDSTQYDDGTGTLAALPGGRYKRDLVFVTVHDGVTEYHVIYAQEHHSSQSAAEAGNDPSPPDQIIESALRLSGPVVLSGATDIASIVDRRPFLGQLATGGTVLNDHGLLTGLGDDDHPQYQLRSEEGAANGYASLDGTSRLPVGQLPSNVGVLTATAPVSVTKAAASAGVSAETARADHKHDISTAAAVNLSTTNSEGAASTLSRSDHTHKATLQQSTFDEISVNTTTVSLTFVDLLSRTLTTIDGTKLQIFFSFSASNTNAGKFQNFAVVVDGVQKRACGSINPGANDPDGGALNYVMTGLSAGSHTIKIQWKTDANTAQIRPVAAPNNEHASLIINEVTV